MPKDINTEREIKFRAWVVPVPLFEGHHAIDPYMETQGDPDLETLQSFMHHYADEKNLMQWTGLKDKNGVDIYEGDIVRKSQGLKLTGRIPQFRQVVGSVKKVVFHDGAWKITKSLASSNYYINSVTIRYYGLEVIGNIYENPKMLETLTDKSFKP